MSPPIRLSTAPGGLNANDASADPVLSSDGSLIAYYSLASNLVGAEDSSDYDIFLYNATSGMTTAVSSARTGVNPPSFDPAISADGGVVVFVTEDAGLAPGDTNVVSDIDVKEIATVTTSLASSDSAGGVGNDFSYDPSISAGGRFVAFRSFATNLVANDLNGRSDIFLKDRVTGETTLISVTGAGVQANGHSFETSVSSDASRVAFRSDASNLIASDTNGVSDVFVKDRSSDEITRVSESSSGLQANGYSYAPSISGNGRYVVFTSVASNLVGGDGNGRSDVFIKDLVTGSLRIVSATDTGAEGNADSRNGDAAVSSDGRFVVFESAASNLVAGDVNGVSDVFLKDMLTGTVTLLSAPGAGGGANGASGDAAISADGRVVAFTSLASNLVADDTNNVRDVFKVDLPPASVVLSGTEDGDLLVGISVAETILGFGGNDTIRAADGSDSVDAGTGDDSARGGLGDDTLEGGDGVDNLFGDAGADRLYGGGETDSLSGGNDDDSLWGEHGNDVLRGNHGDDLLIGGEGADELYGGAGADVFFFSGQAQSPFGAADLIKDFVSGLDVIRLVGIASGGVFIGAAEFTAGGAIEARFDAALRQVQVDLNNNGLFDAADLQIDGPTSVASGDFVFV